MPAITMFSCGQRSKCADLSELLLRDTYEEFMSQTETYTTQLGNDVMNGAGMPSEADIQNQVFEIYYNILRESLDAGVNYGEAQTVTIHVNKGNNII